jgi:hypothetical protein
MSYRPDVRDYLISVAKKHDTVTYWEVQETFHLARGGHKKAKNRVGDIVGNLSEFEHSQGRPYISAIVVHKSGSDRGYPGGGFFGLTGIPKNVRRYGGYSNPLSVDEKAFASSEQARVWAWPYP